MSSEGVNARNRGVVVKFDGDRGYGFIRPDGAPAKGADVFVHISDVAGGGVLRLGQRVEYTLTRTEKGPAAVQVKAGSVLSVPTLRFALVGVGSAFSRLLILALTLDRSISAAVWASLWVVAMSVTTYAVFGFDKSQAQSGGLRVPESVLHLMSLLGGSPGALVAMRFFRHKTRKNQFQVVFGAIVVVQLLLVAVVTGG